MDARTSPSAILDQTRRYPLPNEDRGLRALWQARPWPFSLTLWTLMLGLDLLPWPWGEDILASLFVVANAIHPTRRRRALAWASVHPGRRRWRLAVAVCAFRGRWVARSGLLGRRSPDDSRRHLVVKGREYLTAAPGGTILLGFHLGPPATEMALRILGHRVAALGWPARVSRALWRDAWRPLLDPSHYLATENRLQRLASLQRARQILLDGGTVFVMADGVGHDVFRVPIPGGSAIIMGGWLALHRHTGARILPVLAHLEGRTEVITIHPALPTASLDAAGNLRPWQQILASLLEDYIKQFPEQCPAYALVFPHMFGPTLSRQAARLPDRA